MNPDFPDMKPRWSMNYLRLLLIVCMAFVKPCFAEKTLPFSLLSIDEATQKVLEQGGNKVLATKTENVDGKKVHVIKVLSSDGRVQHIKIDADSGEIINSKPDE